MSGNVLAFRHIPFEHLGRIADSLAFRNIEFEYVDLFSGAPLPDVSNAAGLIFMGGPMSANDDLPHIRHKLALIERAATLGKPILGVCLGAQLIAKALGGRVYPNHTKEIGWYPVYWTDAAREDLQVSAADTVFHWHEETFDLPAGAELLAWSDVCHHQAYRVGKNIYGLQFHLEVTPEMIADWLAQDANCGDLREVVEAIDPNTNAARLEELSRHVFGHWCDLIRK